MYRQSLKDAFNSAYEGISDFGEFVVVPSDDVFVIFKRGTNLSPHPVADSLANTAHCVTVACDEQMYDSLSLGSMRELSGVAAEKYKTLEHTCKIKTLVISDLAFDLKTTYII